MQPYALEVEQPMRRFYGSLSEKERRREAAVESFKLGWGGITSVSQLFACADKPIRDGMKALEQEVVLNQGGIRQAGGGQKSAFETIEGLDAAFLRVIAQQTADSPMAETVKWTNLTRQELAELLQSEGLEVSVTVVDQLLEKHHDRNRNAQKRLATGTHPQCHEQFEPIERWKEAYQAAGKPVLCMDTKQRSDGSTVAGRPTVYAGAWGRSV